MYVTEYGSNIGIRMGKYNDMQYIQHFVLTGITNYWTKAIYITEEESQNRITRHLI